MCDVPRCSSRDVTASYHFHRVILNSRPANGARRLSFFCMAYNRLWRSSLSETSKWDSPKCIDYRVHLWILYSRDDRKTWPAIILTLPDNRQSFYPSEYKDYKPRTRFTPVCVPFARPRCCRADLISTSLRVNWIPIIVTFKVELTLFKTLCFALLYDFFAVPLLIPQTGFRLTTDSPQLPLFEICYFTHPSSPKLY